MKYQYMFIKIFILLLITWPLLGCLEGDSSGNDDKKTTSDTTTSTTVTTSTSTTSTTLPINKDAIQSIEPSTSVGSGASIDSSFKVTFDRVMNIDSVKSSITLSDSNGNVVGIDHLTQASTASTFEFKPQAPLAFSSTYLITIPSGVRDKDGNTIAETIQSTFSTRNASIVLSPTNTNQFKRADLCCLQTLNINGTTDDLFAVTNEGIFRYRNDGSGNLISSLLISNSRYLLTAQDLDNLVTEGLSTDEKNALSAMQGKLYKSQSAFLNEVDNAMEPNPSGNIREQIIRYGYADFSAISKKDVNNDDLEDLILLQRIGDSEIDIIALFNRNDTNTPFSWDSKEITTFNNVVNVQSLGNELIMTAFNKDQAPDLIFFVNDTLSQQIIKVLSGTGVGGFSNTTFLASRSIESGTFIGMAANDFNRDGNLDIAVLSNTEFAWYAGDGVKQIGETSAFDLPVNSVPTFTTPGQMIVADFSGDNFPDVVVTVNNGNNDKLLYLVKSQTDDTFSNRTIAIGQRSGTGPSDSITYGDFDGDQNLDIVVSFQEDNEVVFLFGDGTGNFTSLSQPMATFSGVSRLYASQLDNNTKHDVVALSNSELGLFWGDEERTLSSIMTLQTGTSPSAVVSFDLDNGTSSDIIISNRQEGTISVLYGNGKNSFSRQDNLALLPNTNPSDFLLVDYDNDQQNEIIVVNQPATSNIVGITLLDFSDALQADNTAYQLSGIPMQAILGNFLDSSTRSPLDLAVAVAQPNQLIILSHNAELSDEKDKRYYVEETIDLESLIPVSLATGQFQTEGNTAYDIAVVTESGTSSMISIYYGTGSGVFKHNPEVLTVPTDQITTQGNLQLGEMIAVSDKGVDYVSRLVVIDKGTPNPSISPQNNVFIFENTKNKGEFAFSGALNVPAQPRYMIAKDLNGDEVPELIVSAVGNISIFTNNGAGANYTLVSTTTVGDAPQRVAVSDLNEDEVMDLVIVDEDTNSLSTLLQQ